MISHMALLRMLNRKGEFRIGVIRVVWTFCSSRPVYPKRQTFLDPVDASQRGRWDIRVQRQSLGS